MYTMTGVKAKASGEWSGTIRWMGREVGTVSNDGNGGCPDLLVNTTEEG